MDAVHYVALEYGWDKSQLLRLKDKDRTYLIEKLREKNKKEKNEIEKAKRKRR